MRRLKKHQSSCNKILRLADDRLSGNLRVLMELVALWLDSGESEKPFIADIIAGKFGTKRLRLNDPDDPLNLVTDSSLEAETKKQIREALSTMEESSAVPAT